MTTPATPAECRAEQERWQKRIDAYDAALAKVCRLRDERTARHDAMVQAAGKKGEYCPPIPDPTPEHWDASEAWADAQKDLPDPTLARQYAALLAAHAEALEREARMAAECDMYRVTLQNLHQAAANMLTGIEVNNRLHPDAPARRKGIAGPVVTSLRAAVLSARVALSPNPPTGYAPPPAQAPAGGEG